KRRPSLSQNLCKKAPCPNPIIDVRSRRNEGQALAVVWDPSGESAEFDGIFLRSEVPSTPPRLVSDAPKPNVEGLHISGSRSHVRQGRGAGWGIAVFHPTVKFSGRKAAHIGGQIGLSLDELAKMDEFIGSELVRIVFMACRGPASHKYDPNQRSEEHTSELQSLRHLVCRLLLEKKNKNKRKLIETK